jgi:hypothetical protein
VAKLVLWGVEWGLVDYEKVEKKRNQKKSLELEGL